MMPYPLLRGAGLAADPATEYALIDGYSGRVLVDWAARPGTDARRWLAGNLHFRRSHSYPNAQLWGREPGGEPELMDPFALYDPRQAGAAGYRMDPAQDESRAVTGTSTTQRPPR